MLFKFDYDGEPLLYEDEPPETIDVPDDLGYLFQAYTAMAWDGPLYKTKEAIVARLKMLPETDRVKKLIEYYSN